VIRPVLIGRVHAGSCPKAAGEMDAGGISLRALGASFADLHTSSISTLLGEAPMIEYEFQSWKVDLVSVGVVDSPARWLVDGQLLIDDINVTVFSALGLNHATDIAVLGRFDTRCVLTDAPAEWKLHCLRLSPGAGRRRNHAMCNASVTTLAWMCAFMLQPSTWRLNGSSTAVTRQDQVMLFKGLQA
jgi:hypothetical protein